MRHLPSMFPMHTFYWGDWYGKIIGPEKAAQISPMRSILDAGMIATSHTDAPVALPNLLQVAWATGGLGPAPGNDDGAPAPCAPGDVHLAGGRHQAPSASMSAKA